MIFMNHQPRTATRRRLFQFALGVMALAGVLRSGAQTNAPSNASSNATTTATADTGPTYDTFRIISQRNIFDPNRSAYRPGSDRPRQTRQQRSNYFGLVGTMSYQKGKFAFFDGTESEYRKVLEPGGSIAGYTVKGITNQMVTLAANGKEIEMKVGAQMRQEGDSGWKLSMPAEQPASTDADSETQTDSTDTATSSAPPTGSSPEMNDVLKRLMEKRQQELK